MKRSEIILWIMVAVALAANIWLPKHLRPRYSWERDLSQRYAVDFDKTAADVKDYISRYIPDVTDEQIQAWTESGKLESKEIGRRTMYFRNAGPNLFRIVPELKTLKDSIEGKGDGLDGHRAIDAKVIPLIREDVLSGKGSIALPKRMRVRFSVTVPVNTVKAGSTLRCWLPYPRQDVARQTDIKFIEAGIDSTALPEDKIIFSDPSCAHSSLYMETKANRYHDITFYEVFEYTSSGEWHPIDSEAVKSYNKENPEYQEYTSEREQHVIFIVIN